MHRLYLFFILCLLVSACNIEAVNDDGETDPDSTATFQNVSANLPHGLSGTTHNAKTADLNGEGAPEVVLAIQSKPNKILFNNGSGQFIDKSVGLSNKNYDTRDLWVSDFNDDGYLDIIFVSGSTQPNEFYLNNGSGNFADLSNRVNYPGNSTTVNAWDINNDGSTDIMIGNRGQNTILINNGNAYFANESTQRLPQQLSQTNDLSWADLDGDNWFDIVTADQQNNHLYLNKGSGFFEEHNTDRIPSGGPPTATYDVNLVDVDNDGDLDLYYGNSALESGSNAQDRLLINDGQGYFEDRTAERLPEVATNTSDADFADLNNDGYLDIIIGSFDGGIRVLINDGSGTFIDKSPNWIEEGFAPAINNIALADYNGDGSIDIYLSVRNGTDQLLFQQIR